MTTGATNVTTGNVAATSESKSETGDQSVTQKQEQTQTQKGTAVHAVDVSKHGKIAGAENVHYGSSAVNVPVTAATGAGLFGSLSTLLGAAGLTFTLRRTR